MRAALSFAFALLLSGCAENALFDSEVDADSPVESAVAGNGFAAFSMAQSPVTADSVVGEVVATPLYEWRFEVKRPSDGETFAFRGGVKIVDGRIVEPPEEKIPDGRVYAHSLTPGEYEITAVNLWRALPLPDGTVERSWRGEQALSLPFTIEPRQVSYLGELRCAPTVSENVIGVETADGCAWEISDQYRRDARILLRTFPGLPWHAIENDTLRAGEGPVTFK